MFRRVLACTLLAAALLLSPALLSAQTARASIDLSASAQTALAPGPSVARSNEGYGLAWSGMAVLGLVLLYALAATCWRLLGHNVPQGGDRLTYLIPILCLLGIAVALYLSFVEITSTTAACGPVGDCNAVQRSAYARILGIIPMGLFGVFGHVCILSAWLWHARRNDLLAAYMPLAIFGMTVFGVVFSMYLTYLEIFVIHAVCLWCLASAVIIALLLVVSVGPAMASVATSTPE